MFLPGKYATNASGLHLIDSRHSSLHPCVYNQLETRRNMRERELPDACVCIFLSLGAGKTACTSECLPVWEFKHPARGGILVGAY